MNAHQQAQAEAHRAFLRDTQQHQMTIVRDDGVFRHLKFRNPNGFAYHFDITTWPGHLAITGDMGAAVFSRLHDMFGFFRVWPGDKDPGALYINPRYWAEKCVANDGEKESYDARLLEELVRDRFDQAVADADPDEPGIADDKKHLWTCLEEDVINGEDTVSAALQRMDDFEFAGATNTFARFRFHDVWEYESQLTTYTFHFTWRLYAIAHAVKTYDAAKTAAEAGAA